MTIDLETSEEDRIEYKRFTGGSEYNWPTICALCRDIDRLLADNEAKAREIERLKMYGSQILRDRDWHKGELNRLKSRPTSEEVRTALSILTSLDYDEDR